MKDYMDELKAEMCSELEELTEKKNRSPGDIELIGEIVDIILDIHRIKRYDEKDGYSRDGNWEADMRGTYGRGASYTNRGRHLVREHYSRKDAREELISQIDEAMKDATGRDRELYQRAADILRNS